MPLISIIVPIYNASKTLRNCLDHLIAQTFTDFEVILVNDGSKDSSLEICEEYCCKDRRFSVVSKSNGGVASARNAGIPLAKGKYLTFADADDYAFENWLGDCAVHMDGVGLVVAGAKTTGFNKDLPDYHPLQQRVSVSEALLELVDNKMLGYTWHKFYLTRVLQEEGLSFDTAFQPREDEEFLLRYLPHVKDVQFTDSAQYVYDVPDFGSKYPALSHEMLNTLAIHIREACSDSRAYNAYQKQGFRSVIWNLRHGTMTPESLASYKKVRGLRQILASKSSLGTKLLFCLPSGFAVKIFAWEGHWMNGKYR